MIPKQSIYHKRFFNPWQLLRNNIGLSSVNFLILLCFSARWVFHTYVFDNNLLLGKVLRNIWNRRWNCTPSTWVTNDRPCKHEDGWDSNYKLRLFLCEITGFRVCTWEIVAKQCHSFWLYRHKVAVVDQLETPATKKKKTAENADEPLRRELQKIITPGTVVEENLIKDFNALYLMAVVVRTRNRRGEEVLSVWGLPSENRDPS